jgi:outer membrane lipoprotein carrier protein
MRKFSFHAALIVLACYSGFWLLAPGSSAQATSVDEIIKKLQARYDATAGFRADFRQEVESATLGQRVESRGQVLFKKPGRMRWEFHEPEQLVVADGTFFWLYQPTDNQVIRMPFQQAFRSNVPVSFLTGVGRLDQDFIPSLSGETTETYILRLTPKHEAEGTGLLDLEIRTETFDIVQATITDPLGNTTRVRFTNIDRETLPDDALFRFTVPDGVDVIEAPPAS